MKDMKLKNRCAILTGGGRGIGEAVAHAFAQEGANLILVSRTANEIKQVATSVKTYGVEVLPLVGDVAKESTAEKIVKETLHGFGRIDSLVNCAGILGPVGRFDTLDWKKWKQTFEVNFFGTLLCIRAVLPFMMQQHYGKIITFSGGGATSPLPNFTAYGSSKAAVVRVTETLAQEYKPFHIDINAIAPGAVPTRMQEEILAAGESAGVDYHKKMMAIKEKGGTPPEVAAQLAVFLASAASDGLTGKLISAPWDHWKEFPSDENQALSESSLYTLRRIDNMQFFEKKEGSR